ncbi:MAG: prepilin-type N-terminal cleavage/methylation domain-containing protein [Candidatus Vogelbacteria bacterium]|nr:prepilin-type N-terminal cleavage/methylation domain-containing protein [Candidatus Vogelbacteria bacterium]
MNPQPTSGFTLIEALVAITILVIAVLGPLGTITRGITDGFYAQNQLVGTYLTQEGLELLSLRIDENNRPNEFDNLDHDGSDTVDIDDLLYGLEVCKNADCAVVFESADNLVDFSFDTCANANNCEIAYHPVDGFYKPYDGGAGFTGPVFTRALRIDTLTDTEVLLSSEVKWKNKTTDPEFKSVKLSRYAFHQK